MMNFEELLSDLSKQLKASLHLDHLGACTLQIREKIRVQMQLDQPQKNLLMACMGIEIPPGAFRELVLKEALKTNALPEPRPAVLSYLHQKNILTFHQIIPLPLLDGERLSGYLGAFLEEVESWIQAIEQGKACPKVLSSPEPSSLSSSLGMKL